MINNYSGKTILVVMAHPDDTEIFCAGTLFLLKDLGFSIIIATMTNGELGSFSTNTHDTAEIRYKEAETAASFLGARYLCLNQPDGYLFDSREIRTELTEIMRKFKTDILITHRFDDYHPDHRATAEITEAAAIVSALPNIKTLSSPLSVAPLLYKTDTYSSKDRMGEDYLIPDFFIDISVVIDKKMKMLSFHHSQEELMVKMFKINDFFAEMKGRDKFHGNRSQVEYAEAFWQHRGGGFQTDPIIQTALQNRYIKEKI